MKKEIKRNFSDEEWDATPKAVQAYIISLENLVLELLDHSKSLEQRIEKLEAKGNKNSRNSSKPPSSDSPYERRQNGGKSSKDGSKKKAGGKKGHPGHHQELLPPSNTIPVSPAVCDCGCEEVAHLESFYTHQEIELPEIEMIVTHFILHKGQCSDCGKLLKATLPEAHQSGYGPRLSALIGELNGIQGNSRTTIRDFCKSVLKFHISLGAINKVIGRVSKAILPHYQAIGEVARNKDINYIDETSWFKKGALMWLWVMVNCQVAFFLVHPHRSKEAFYALIEDWEGILVSDGYGVYKKWVNLRQSCLAHLIRDARGLAEGKNVQIRSFGKKALRELQYMCNMAKAPPDEKEWNTFYTRFVDLIFDHLQREDDAGKFARRLLRQWDSLWTFLEVLDVEPTNNRAERTIRFGVLWRKRSMGTQSDNGGHWVERILSLRQTARIRGTASFPILTEAMCAYFENQKPDLSWIYSE